MYIPESGDIIWITFNPQAGHEQAGRRPALVLSPAAYNGFYNNLIINDEYFYNGIFFYPHI